MCAENYGGAFMKDMTDEERLTFIEQLDRDIEDTKAKIAYCSSVKNPAKLNRPNRIN